MQWIYIVAGIIAVILLIYVLRRSGRKEEYQFSDADIQLAKTALESFEYSKDRLQVMSDDEFNKVVDDVVLAVFPKTDPTRENFNSLNTRYWPEYYYSFPYNYKYGTPWPSGLFSRMYSWTPGFNMGTGWLYYIRPGNDYNPDRWPRNRWIRNNGNYYYVSNRGDYAKDAANYNYINSSNWQ